MQVLYDSQCFDMQRSGGISRYFCEIIKNLPDSVSYQLPLSYSKNIYLKENLIVPLVDNEKFNKKETFLSNIKFRGKGRLHNLRNKIFYSNLETNRERDIEALKKQNFDVFHPTYYDPYFLDYIGNKPFVLTIHDMIHEKYPEMLMDVKTIRNKKLLASKASHIIAISEQTKQDVMDILHIPESKISVIYHGTSQISNDVQNIPNKYGKYLLFTGTRTIYKNFYFMLLSLSEWLYEHSDVSILCTSSDFSDFEKKLIIELGLKDRVLHTFFNNDSEMYSLYKNALAFIFPSYYEGFGIPVLEAFEAQCPSILSDLPCFREIADDAALYFSSKNKEQLLSALNKIYSDSKLRAELIKKGTTRLAFFSWNETAKKTASVYELFN